MSFDREAYDLMKANGICPRCKGDALPGRAHCASCISKVTAWGRLNPEKRRKYWSRHHRSTRLDKIEEGLCDVAGCENPRGADTLACEPCRERRNIADRLRAKRGHLGFCAVCGGRGHNRRTCKVAAANRRQEVALEHYATARMEAA